MSDTFNGYHVWLGIPPSEQPPNHYRLLGITAFESDLDVIDHAADRQMAHVRTFQAGRHGVLSQQILNELAVARLCLLNAQKKASYDEELRAKLSGVSAGAVPVAVPVAVPMAKPLPVARPVSRPAAQPVKEPPSRPQPTGPPLVTPALPKIDEEIALDVEPGAGGLPASESTLIRVKRRRYKRDSTWQSAAIVGTLAALVIIGGFVLYHTLKDLDWKQIFQDVAPTTSSPSTTPPASSPSPPGPGAN